MKKSFYPRMSLSGIKKNGKIYLPYILSCILMIMMFYMIHTLSYSPALKSAKGGATLVLILSLGKFVIAVFSLLFLLYTNSFLTKSRYKEFGLYSILGMDKKGISRIILWESLFVAAISLASGILAGVLLSKLAELALLNAIRAESGFDFNFSTEALLYTLGLYIIVFAVLTVKSLITVRKSDPLALLRSSRTGEKPIKSNAVFAVIGIIILAAAYYLSVSIKTPLTAIPVFFAAVIMVIIATYMIFISGSVALCKLLKKKKNYYYDKKHFVSVSSMTYRMKRNGAGLASICILCTMVLVMISSTSSLYFGADESLSKRFIKDNSISVSFENLEDFNENNVKSIRNCYEGVFKEYKFKPENVYEYRYVEISGKTEVNNVNPVYNPNLSGIGDISDVVTVYFIAADEYSRIGGSETLIKDNEVLIFTDDLNYKSDKISIANIEFDIVGNADREVCLKNEALISNKIVPEIMLVVSDFDVVKPIESASVPAEHNYYYSYDSSSVDDETAVEIFKKLQNSLVKSDVFGNGEVTYRSACLASEKEDFYSTYGGLFFLGIILSVLFIFAAAMIIYYKQISEGYEDKEKFDIMQKVGMTKRDIRKSINSQVLTVFFAPLIFAALHLAFAFPLIWKLLQLFSLDNVGYVIIITAAAFIAFAAFYAVIYKITAKAYFTIVSSEE